MTKLLDYTKYCSQFYVSESVFKESQLYMNLNKRYFDFTYMGSIIYDPIYFYLKKSIVKHCFIDFIMEFSNSLSIFHHSPNKVLTSCDKLLAKA